jgi:acyl-CoA reductase-like NAD-dependent aldehyde dehydrogenase
MNPPPAAPSFAAESHRCKIAQQAWSQLRVADRVRPLGALRRLLVEHADRVCAVVEKDVGRPPAEVVTTDLLPTADSCKYHQKYAARILAPRRVSIFSRPLWLFGSRDTVYHRPHGVVGIIGTWNYPIYLNAIQMLQALTAGNGVLWKPSELTPETAVVLHELFLKAGYPPDLVQRLPATREAGPQLAEADVDHVVFTGSAAVGRKLAARLGERLVSSTLELSGIDAMFVLADADVRLAARAAWFGANINKGQTCLAVRRIFVHRSVYLAFLDALRPLATAARPCPLVLESQVREANRLVADALSHGATLLAPKTDLVRSKAEMCPAVVTDARPDMAICREVSFAPIAAVIPFDRVDEAVAMSATCEYGLGASIFSASKWEAERLAARVGSGMVAINDVIAPAGHPATPFSGVGASGWGVSQGEEGLLAMTVPQVVSVRSGTFRPHFLPLDEAPHVAETTRGLFEWSHGNGRQRVGGLKRILRNLRRFL